MLLVKGDLVSLAFDNNFAALGTIGIIVKTRIISHIYIAQSAGGCNLAGTFQTLARGSRMIRHHVIGMKGRQVQGRIFPAVLYDPLRAFFQTQIVIVDARYQERGDLRVDTLIYAPEDSIQHGPQRTTGIMPVDGVRKCFQIDIDGAQPAENGLPGKFTDIPVRDKDAGYLFLFGQVNDIQGVFRKDDGLVVGKCNGFATVVFSRKDKLLGRNVFMFTPVLCGQMPVLAKFAGEVTALRANTESTGPR